MSTAVQIRGLSKKYRIGTFVSYGRLTESISNAFRRPFHRDGGGRHAEWIWALKDVSMDIAEGEVLGVIGRNGAGKTTLLKISSRITEPTEGTVSLWGRVGSLLEVGTGFHPELTGRENVYLNGAILGMGRTEIRKKFDDIVEFSEITQFLDTPVKRYSSGMYIRLAFAVAAHLEPDILIVDEVLAVGDAAFQAKCLGKMSDVAREGRTVVFVTHNMSAVTRLCTRACWIDDGHLRLDGTPGQVVAAYLSSGVDSEAKWAVAPSEAHGTELQVTAAEVKTSSGEQAAGVPFDEPFSLEVSFRVMAPVKDAAVLIRLTDLSGNVVFESWDTDSALNGSANRVPGTYLSACSVPGALLKPGKYWLSLAAHVPNRKPLDQREHVLAFDVLPVSGTIDTDRMGVLTPVLNWVTERVP